MRNASTVIAVLLVAALIRAYAVLRRVMGGSVDQVHARIAALGHGDFLNPIVVREKRRDSVMGWLSETRDKLAAGARENEDAMRQLRASETQFRQIAENIREVFFLGNLDGTQILYVSPGYEELWGRTCASLYADPDSWREAVHPEDRVKVSAAIAIGGAKGQFEYECRIIRPDETLRVRAFPIRDDEGIVHRIAGFAIDTTHRTKLEVTPRDEDRRFNDVVDNLPSPCFIANARGRITYCNDAALALTGWNRVELLGRPSAEILNRVLAREGSLAATTWRHIRLSSEEGTPQGTAMLGEAALH